MHELPFRRGPMGVHAPCSDSRMHDLPHRAGRAPERCLCDLPYHGQDLGVHPSGVVGHMYVVPHPACGSRDRNMRHVSHDGRLLEVPAPVLGKLLELSHQACEALHRCVFRMPLPERSICKCALHASRREGELRDMPHEAREALRGYVQHLPFAEGGVL